MKKILAIMFVLCILCLSSCGLFKDLDTTDIEKYGIKPYGALPNERQINHFHISKKAGVMMGVAAVKKVGNRVATTYISQIGVRTGNVTLQEKLAYDKGVAMRAIGIGTTLIVGAATGNPLAIAAGVGSAISWGVDIAVAQEQLNLERAVENIGIQQANIRAGAGGDRSGRNTY